MLDILWLGDSLDGGAAYTRKQESAEKIRVAEADFRKAILK